MMQRVCELDSTASADPAASGERWEGGRSGRSGNQDTVMSGFRWGAPATKQSSTPSQVDMPSVASGLVGLEPHLVLHLPASRSTGVEAVQHATHTAAVQHATRTAAVQHATRTAAVQHATRAAVQRHTRCRIHTQPGLVGLETLLVRAT